MESHYPSYSILELKEDWDPHTRGIVLSRLYREHGYLFLDWSEAEVLQSLCSLLCGDTRGEILQYVVSHIDESLHKQYGEGQRKLHVPEERVLVREGIKALEQSSILRYALPFFQLEEADRRTLLLELSEARMEPQIPWKNTPQKAFFQKVLTLAIEAYYSHPTVWSEIGYGGPAYPRGYIRTGFGQLDPWEAKRER